MRAEQRGCAGSFFGGAPATSLPLAMVLDASVDEGGVENGRGIVCVIVIVGWKLRRRVGLSSPVSAVMDETVGPGSKNMSAKRSHEQGERVGVDVGQLFQQVKKPTKSYYMIWVTDVSQQFHEQVEEMSANGITSKAQ
ncbi:hypothetical protein BKA82DRAFT_4012166 [Pisolithus tinctorius]|nr:hypothetical protein BKA82DRAFT_4012166 [Pisolithus tinctorius]